MTAALAAGQLNHRVVIQSRQTTRAANGAQVESWINVDTVWAQVRDMRGAKYFRDQALNEVVDREVRMRAHGAITAAHRLLIDGEPYEIVELITADAPDEHLQVLARQGVRDGR